MGDFRIFAFFDLVLFSNIDISDFFFGNFPDGRYDESARSVGSLWRQNFFSRVGRTSQRRLLIFRPEICAFVPGRRFFYSCGGLAFFFAIGFVVVLIVRPVQLGKNLLGGSFCSLRVKPLESVDFVAAAPLLAALLLHGRFLLFFVSSSRYRSALFLRRILILSSLFRGESECHLVAACPQLKSLLTRGAHLQELIGRERQDLVQDVDVVDLVGRLLLFLSLPLSQLAFLHVLGHEAQQVAAAGSEGDFRVGLFRHFLLRIFLVLDFWPSVTSRLVYEVTVVHFHVEDVGVEGERALHPDFAELPHLVLVEPGLHHRHLLLSLALQRFPHGRSTVQTIGGGRLLEARGPQEGPVSGLLQLLLEVGLLQDAGYEVIVGVLQEEIFS